MRTATFAATLLALAAPVFAQTSSNPLASDVERVSAEIGYWLGEACWGRGVCTEALAAVTAYALDTYGLTRVFAVPFAHNAASCRVLEKAGYTMEGRLRRSAIKDGRICDQLLYAFVPQAATAPAADATTGAGDDGHAAFAQLAHVMLLGRSATATAVRRIIRSRPCATASRRDAPARAARCSARLPPPSAWWVSPRSPHRSHDV